MAYETENQYTKPRVRAEDRTVHVDNRTGGASTGLIAALGIAALVVLGLVFIDWDGDAGSTTVIEDAPNAVVVEPSGSEATTAPMTETAPEASAPAAEETAPAAEETAPAAEETAPPADQ